MCTVVGMLADVRPPPPSHCSQDPVRLCWVLWRPVCAGDAGELPGRGHVPVLVWPGECAQQSVRGHPVVSPLCSLACVHIGVFLAGALLGHAAPNAAPGTSVNTSPQHVPQSPPPPPPTRPHSLRRYPWAMLVAMQLLMPNVSFVGHLCGLLCGFLHVRCVLVCVCVSA